MSWYGDGIQSHHIIPRGTFGLDDIESTVEVSATMHRHLHMVLEQDTDLMSMRNLYQEMEYGLSNLKELLIRRILRLQFGVLQKYSHKSIRRYLIKTEYDGRKNPHYCSATRLLLTQNKMLEELKKVVKDIDEVKK